MKKIISFGIGIALLASPVLVSAQSVSSSNTSLIATLTALVQILEQELQSLLAARGTTSQTMSPSQVGAQIHVAGMTQYSDSSFGFSFWYPTSWTVTPTNDAVSIYYGKTLQKSFSISNGIHSITISEYVSPSGIQDVCGKCDDRIYFDQVSNSWKDFTGWTIEEGLSGAHTDPADVSVTTIGGLPLMWNSVAALDASHFVVADAGNAANDPTNLLLQTITSLNPTAVPKSTAEQQRVIQAEANAMGATITSNGASSGTIDTITSTGLNYPVSYDIAGMYQNTGDLQILIVKGTDTFSSDPLPHNIFNQLPSNVVMDTCNNQFSPCDTIKTDPYAASGTYSYKSYALFIKNGLYTVELYTIPNATNNNSFQLLATKQITVTTATQ